MGDHIGVQLSLSEIYLSLTNHPGQLSLAIPPWVGAMSTDQRAVMLCDWGVKADMVLFAGNTVWSISERVRGVCVDALYKSTFTLLYFTLLSKTAKNPRKMPGLVLRYLIMSCGLSKQSEKKSWLHHKCPQFTCSEVQVCCERAYLWLSRDTCGCKLPTLSIYLSLSMRRPIYWSVTPIIASLHHT